MAGLIEDEGEAKKQYAVSLAERWLAQFGIALELDTLADLIELRLWRSLAGKSWWNQSPAS